MAESFSSVPYKNGKTTRVAQTYTCHLCGYARYVYDVETPSGKAEMTEIVREHHREHERDHGR